jgi:hypothetical protein
MRYTLPIFLGGVGSALEVFPVPHLYKVRRFPEGLNDAQRLALDWYLVGHALYSAIDSTDLEIGRGEEQKPDENR